MRPRFLPTFALLAILVTACNQTVDSLNFQKTEQLTLNKNTRNIEETVDKKRLENNLAILSGKSNLADGSQIKERGGSEGRLKTRKFIADYLTNLGYKVEKHQYRKTGENIFAILPAENKTTDHILIGAHLDSVSNAGADDNGSGSAAVLEAATVLKELKGRKVNIIFSWFDEEELGLVGSTYLAKDFKNKGMKISSVHTADMIGWDKDNDRTVEIERPDGYLWDYYLMVNKKHNLNLPLKRTSSGSTDHVAFREQGFASVGLCEEWAGGDTTPYYHRKTDTYETINFDYLTSTTRLMVAAIGDLSLGVPAPKNIKLLPHDQFPGRDRHFHNH